MPNGPRISLCMIARDEEAFLSGCLDSVEGVVDERILVDTGSRDRTRDLARARGCRVLEHTWRHDFSAARNAGLDAATGDWILVLDADEALEPRSREILRSLLAGSDAQGLRVTVRNLAPPGDLARHQDNRITRLFRRHPSHRYEWTIHEQISGAIERNGGRVQDAPILVLHHGYASPLAQGGQSRLARNQALLEAALERSPQDPLLHFHLGSVHKAAGHPDLARLHLERALSWNALLDRETLTLLHMRLAQLALARREPKEARRHASLCLAMDPENVVAHHVLAHICIEERRLSEAALHLEAVLRSPARDPRSDGDVGRVLAACRRIGR